MDDHVGGEGFAVAVVGRAKLVDLLLEYHNNLFGASQRDECGVRGQQPLPWLRAASHLESDHPKAE